MLEEECRRMQQEEWEVLESIYPDCVSSGLSSGSLRLEIPVELDGSHKVVVQSKEASHSLALTLSTLPTILLDVVLAATYPLDEPPQLKLIRATHLWYPHVSRLRDELQGMWQPGDGVLYNWIEFIRSGQFLEADCLSSDTITIPHAAPNVLASLLATYATDLSAHRFSQNSYPCSICLSNFKGSKCLQLSCGHIFCRTCLQEFWHLCVTEGDIIHVRCPDPLCVKNGTDASEEEVARVLTSAEIERWRWLKEKQAMEQDPTIVHCPMTFCQKPVPKTATGIETESGWDRLRTCPSCSYSFCSFCKHGWHGPISPCLAAATDEMVRQYLAVEEGSSERDVLFRKYGRTNVLKLVAAYEDDQLYRKWLESSTTTCPGCDVRVEKSVGCNHMTCAKCQQHFCYRCGQRLIGNPYAHFSTPGLPCFNKLFDLNSIDDDDGWIEIHDFEGL